MSSSPEKEKDESITSIKMDRDNGLSRSDRSNETCLELPILDPKNPKPEATIKLQKFYKKFGTSRKLTYCTVLAEQSWWKLLDFVELEWCSISYFDIEKCETPNSCWTRTKIRVAKVAKGLSKNDKAQKLDLQVTTLA